MSTPFERGMRRAAQRQKLAQEVFAQQLTKNVDVETLLLDKLVQKTKGGATSILQQFKRMDSTTGDGAEISFAQFKECLEKFGLPGIRDEDVMKLFRKYDDDGSGSISFAEFTAHVAKHFTKLSTIGFSSTDIQDAKRARERARILKKQAIRTGWKTVSVDAERLLLEKIEQRLKGGNNTLRLAFRRFDNGKGDSAINFQEFQESLRRLGLQGISSEDALQLFQKFDDDGNGEIDFAEFAEFVMKRSSEHNSISVSTDSAAREAKRLRDKALRKAKESEELHWKYAAKHIDIEQLLVEKVLQKLNGGSDALLRAFCLFDKSRGDSAEIDPDSFKQGLESLGLVGIPDKLSRRLFKKYDRSGDGKIDFSEFIKRISMNYSPLDYKEPPMRRRHKSGSCKKCTSRHKHHHHQHSSRSASSRSSPLHSSTSTSRIPTLSRSSSRSEGRSLSSTRSEHQLPDVMVTGRKIK